jgi:hypothetical protein
MSDDGKFAFNPRLEKGYHASFQGRHEQWFGIKNGEEHLGHMAVEADDVSPKDVNIRNVELKEGPNKLGPKHVRRLLGQLKEHYPTMETVSGRRDTGARHGGKETYTPGSGVEVKVKV